MGLGPASFKAFGDEALANSARDLKSPPSVAEASAHLWTTSLDRSASRCLGEGMGVSA